MTSSIAAGIRLLVCDVDGTLVRRDKSLSDANVLAIRQLALDHGIATTLISARPISGLRAIADALALDGPMGAFNGGTVFDHEGLIGAPERLPPDAAQLILGKLDAAGVDAWVFANGRWYARHANNPHTAREVLSCAQQPVLQNDLQTLCDMADKIVGVSDDVALLQRLEDEIQSLTRGEATVARSQPYFLDCTGLLANKGDGLAAIARAIGVPLDAIAVIGDMHNDVPMFERAGLAIAMGQAPEEVREAAHWTTTSNEEGGVAKAIERLREERLQAERAAQAAGASR